MYNALNEDYMFQEMHDRVAQIRPRADRGRSGSRRRRDSLTNRRWWHKATALAG